MHINKYIKKIFITFLGLSVFFLFFLSNNNTDAASNNLIKNPSVETSNPSNSKLPRYWVKDFFGNNTRVFTYPVTGQDGNKALKIELKKVVSGDAKWEFADVPVSGGKNYEFSDYYQSNIKSYLVARYLVKNGSYKYVDVAILDPASSWTKKVVQVTTPSNATSMTVYHLIKNVGWLTTDNFSLTPVSDVIPIVVPTSTPTTAPIVTISPSPTTENTPTPTTVPTDTPVVSPSPIIPTETLSPTPTETIIPSPTIVIDTVSPTSSPEVTETPIPSNTDTPVPTNIPTEIPTVNPSPTDTIVPTPINTIIPSPTIENTPTPTTVPTDTPVVSPSPTATPSAPPTNNGLIINGNLESVDAATNLPTSWFEGNWGTNSATFTYPVTGNNSDKAAKVDITQFTDGDAKWYFQDVNVEANYSYLFSDDYISNVATRLVAQYKMGDGTYTYQELASVNSASSWQSLSQTITPPSNAVSFTVFHLLDKIGSLTIDNASMSKTAIIPGSDVTPTPTSTPTQTPDVNALQMGLVSLDFDDGWGSTFQNGLPIINGAGFKSTLYIISRYIGDPEYGSSDQILAAQAAGNEIGAHSKTHPQLPLLTETQMQDEIGGSRQDLLNMGATPVNSFSYPYGEYNSTALSLVNSAGFKSARTALYEDGGFNDKSTNVNLLKTQSVESTTTLSEIQGWIDTAVKNKTWLILVMHQVDNSGGQYSISPSKLQSVVNYLKTNNVKVVTASEGVSYLK